MTMGKGASNAILILLNVMPAIRQSVLVSICASTAYLILTLYIVTRIFAHVYIIFISFMLRISLHFT